MHPSDLHARRQEQWQLDRINVGHGSIARRPHCSHSAIAFVCLVEAVLERGGGGQTREDSTVNFHGLCCRCCIHLSGLEAERPRLCAGCCREKCGSGGSAEMKDHLMDWNSASTMVLLLRPWLILKVLFDEMNNKFMRDLL
jgi:hypothetical protein